MEQQVKSDGLNTRPERPQGRLPGIERSEFYLREGERLAHMGSWSLRPDGTFDYWSPETFVLFGFDPSEGITDNSRALLVCLCKKSSAPTRSIGDGGTSCQSLS